MTLAAPGPDARCQTGRPSRGVGGALAAAGAAELQPKPEEPEVAPAARRSQ